MEKLSVILSDNQTLTRTGIISVLTAYYQNRIIFEEARTKDDLFEKLRTNQFQAVIIDFDLIDFQNISELGDIKKLFPSIGVLIVSANQNAEDIIKVLDAGITNYILKSCTDNDLIEAFSATLSSRKYFSNEVLDVLLQKKSSVRQNVEPGKLTVAEIEIVRQITQGLTTKEIASQKNLSFHTIITHRKNIFRKLGITNSSELHMYALRAGIIDSTEYYI